MASKSIDDPLTINRWSLVKRHGQTDKKLKWICDFEIGDGLPCILMCSQLSMNISGSMLVYHCALIALQIVCPAKLVLLPHSTIVPSLNYVNISSGVKLLRMCQEQSIIPVIIWNDINHLPQICSFKAVSLLQY